MDIKSLKFKLPVIFSVYLIMMVIISSAMIVNSLQKSALEEKMSKNAVIADLMSKKIEIYLGMAMDNLTVSATLLSNSPKDEDSFYSEIHRLYENYSSFGLVFFTNTEGRMVYSNPYNPIAIEEKIYTDRDYYNHIMKYQKPYVSQLYISRVLGRPHFVLASPVFDDGDLYGLIAGGIPLKEVKNVIKSTDTTFNGGIWVTDAYGALIVNPYEELSDEVITKFDNRKILFEGEEIDLYSVISSRSRGSIIDNRDGEEYYISIVPVENSSLVVMVEQEKSVFFSEAFDVLDQLELIALIIILVGIFLGAIISLGISRPINKLADLVKKWGKGEDLLHELEFRRKDEIGELALVFKDMAFELDKKVLELKESLSRENNLQQYLNNILMSVGSGIVAVDSINKIVIYNKAAETICGLKGEMVIGEELEVFSNKINCDLRSLIIELESKKDTMIERESFILNSEKRSIPCRAICSSVKNRNGEGIGYVFLIISLEAIRMMEEELKREDRLSIVGEFSTSIIHDIGNPLAGLSNLIELYKDNSTEEKERSEILTLIEEEIGELNQIVLEFLNFTKSSEHKEVNVNICQVVSEVINILRTEMINRNVKIHNNSRCEEIYADIDRRNIKQALINIIKNSIQAVEDSGHIFVDSLAKDDSVQIVIRDTGVGIKEDEISKIFEPFYTTKKNGTGLGLSSAYKTVRANDGRIDVSSIYGEGTEFTITLPRRRHCDESSNNR